MIIGMRKLIIKALLAGALSAAAAAATAYAKNGFDLSAATIPTDEILRGGPPRDGIPSIDRPQFASAKNANFMRDDDLVLGVAIGNSARAYPIKILNWHEIVNDELEGAPLAVTFCPLCGSGVVFRAEDENGRRLQFGVSGLLYNSDVLLYDRETESLWSQLLRRGISGEYADAVLRTLPAYHTTWRDWRNLHPQTEVLTTDTGAFRDYDVDPYKGYYESAATYFPATPEAPRKFHPKEIVLGIVAGDAAKAYPFSELEQNEKSKVRDVVNGREIIIHWNAEAQAARAEWPDKKQEGESVRAFWFAWFAFHPQTEIFQAE